MKNEITYFDTASVGLLSDATLNAGHKYDDLWASNASQIFYNFIADDLPRIKEKAALFLGIDADRLAFAPNFSCAFSMFLTSVKAKRKNVLLLEHDYPSLVAPFQIQGFKISWLPSSDGFSWPLELIENEFIAKKIELFAISQVQYLTGMRSDVYALAKICKKHNVLFLVDATQSLGAVPFNFDQSGIDALFASNYKWMNGGFGSAVACFKEGIIEQFPPQIAGYGSYRMIDGQFSYTPSAASYEPGHMMISSILSLENAIDEKNKIGLEHIEKHNSGLAVQFIAGLKNTNFELIGPPEMTHRSAIVCIKGDHSLHEKLLLAGFKAMYRAQSIRFAFHYYNTVQEIEQLLRLMHSINKTS